MVHVSRFRRPFLLLLPLLGLLGCYNTPIDVSEFARGPAPLRMPSPGKDGGCCYEDSLEGGHIFEMYCAECHNPRPLAERPFSNYQNAAAHMRVRVNLTGKEYAKLVAWMRRWADVPPPNPPVDPSAKVVTFTQPVQELRPEAQKGAEANGRQ
jgi:hypothetical protein